MKALRDGCRREETAVHSIYMKRAKRPSRRLLAPVETDNVPAALGVLVEEALAPEAWALELAVEEAELEEAPLEEAEAELLLLAEVVVVRVVLEPVLVAVACLSYTILEGKWFSVSSLDLQVEVTSVAVVAVNDAEVVEEPAETTLN